MIRVAFRHFAVTFLVAGALVLAGCAKGGGHTRGMFSGQVMGKTEAEIVDKYGQPAAAERGNPEMQVLVYKSVTFDPENENKSDAETVIYLTKKDGKVVATDVAFRG